MKIPLAPFGFCFPGGVSAAWGGLAPRTMKALATTLLLAFASTAIAADLPDYRPQRQVSGTIRARGSERMAGLMKRWEAGFRKYHPDARFEDALKGSASGMYGLEMRTADIALMGRPINPYERYGIYERSWVYPLEIEVATGSDATPHKSPAYAILVQRDNPLARLTLKQLDGIFGAERGGGWDALTWDKSAARGRDQNIRTWGQLGLTGEWADKPIHVYGPPNLGAGTITYFQTRVMGGGAIFNEELREYADRRQMVADMSGDRYAIGYGPLAYRSDALKAIAIAEDDASPFVQLTRNSVATRAYPLSRPVYIYCAIDNEVAELVGPDPKVREFLRYVLSRQGQRDVMQGGDYLPLPATVVNEQLRKLDSRDVPPERKLLKDE